MTSLKQSILETFDIYGRTWVVQKSVTKFMAMFVVS
jgi:hypothetical protein